MTKASAPTPAVQHLPTLLRRIQTGDIVVPAFQRGVVWKPKQILELLTSVYRGFPVGSLLLWMVDDGAISPERLMGRPFPSVPMKAQRHYVLDGHQRLASLYGTLLGDGADAAFRVAFDLRNEVFDFENEMTAAEASVLLSDLFAPKAFMQRQRALAGLADGDVLLDRAIGLHTAFQEYMIPLVTISDRGVDEVVQIFERINSTGTKLDAVDFLRAVTWSQGFDLNSHLAELARLAKREGFWFGAERLARLFAVVMDKDPTAEHMLSLRGCAAEKLAAGIKTTKAVLSAACAFLRDDAGIYSADQVPYDAQLLVVGRLFATSDLSPDKSIRRQVVRWLLASTLNEEFQGKADHRVARIVRSVSGRRNKKQSLLRSELNLTVDHLVQRRLLRGGALSSGIGLVLAHGQPRSLSTGDEIATDMALTPEQFAPIVPFEELASALPREPQSAKVLANLLLCEGPSEARRIQRDGWAASLQKLELKLGRREAQAVLRSQLLSAGAVTLLKQGDVPAFLHRRAQDILHAANVLVQ